ncbi:MAG: helicase-exonuclease AddAB subunit AddB [Lachnospiraceae bacterium]|nr:helicase-exonuclease AddAB subunit AddB [Lachnospiraceae bacterium]
MSLRFYFGSSGAGKSTQVYTELLGRAKEQPRRNFLIVVPDQFTMQTQKELVTLSDCGGILNIDVLSFGRLGHRILEEVGSEQIPVLDDTGKSLILQKVAGSFKDQLPTLGSLLQKQGYIHEVKSAISEFMQYGIGTEDVSKLIAFAGKRGALVGKLKDLETLYKGFVDYIHGNYITTEETLDVLRRFLHRSSVLKDSVVVFDGFTGFTPIQNRLIQELMRVCGEVIVVLTLGAGEDPYVLDEEQKLFHLTKKTVADLTGLAAEVQVPRAEDVFVAGEQEHRFVEVPALQHLERQLFRYPGVAYQEEQREIQIFETTTPREEVHQTGLAIRALLQEGYAFRDIAIIMGDLEGYAPYVETEFAQMEIPVFIDRTRGIVLNPMIEYIKSALELYLKDFSYEAVFHYLRSGLCGIGLDEIDALENYVLQTGLRGYRKWNRLFTHKTESMGEDEEPLQTLNAIREQLMQQVQMLHVGKKETAGELVDRLYDFLTSNQVQQKLVSFEHIFTEQGNLTRAKEYAQIYRLVMELLEQIYELLKEEEITLQEFADILEAGFGEIEVGTIPQNVDRVVVGDMERTRLKPIKVLFFLGVNDGNIPKGTSKGGIISDMDREFLRESELELAPSPRQQMYIQRLYLYLNMTKPSKRLYLSYAKLNSEGKSIRPAYLIDTVQKLFPCIQVQYPEARSVSEQIVTPKEGEGYLAAQLRDYVEGVLRPEEQQTFFTIYHAYGQEALAGKRTLFTEAAFRQYKDSSLAKAVAIALYGLRLENSVTRLETYASCAYRHFLQYGLNLKEREEFGFESVDMGNVYHAVLEMFAGKMQEKGYTWFDFPEEFAQETVQECLEAYAASYGDTILYSSARNAYAITRMGRILTRTVKTLQHQLKQGTFVPDEYELSFHYTSELESINVALSKEERMRLQGRIDRVDVAEDSEHVYVKIIDYKSGNRQFDLAALYYGLQLQLVVYMNAAMEVEAGKHPDKEVIPAALLYYHIDDPTVESAVELTDQEINEQLLGKLRMNGVVNNSLDVVERLDGYMQGKSQIIPVEKKKDGSFSTRSSVMSREELQLISNYVNVKVQEIGRGILDGNIAVNPYEKGSEGSCTYCAYKKICGFDMSVPGYEKRALKELDKEEALEKLKEQVEI